MNIWRYDRYVPLGILTQIKAGDVVISQHGACYQARRDYTGHIGRDATNWQLWEEIEDPFIARILKIRAEHGENSENNP